MFIILGLGLYGCASVVQPSSSKATTNQPYISSQPLNEPKLFAEGIISTGDEEFGMTFMPDGLTVYFVKAEAQGRFQAIVFSHFQDGKWITPEVAAFSGQWRDIDPFITPDGKKLFFASNRPLGGTEPKKDFDIWVVDKTASGWSSPRNLGAPVNTEGMEINTSVTSNGTLYVAANDRPGSKADKGKRDLYRFKLVNGAYASAELLDEPINLPQYDDANHFIAPDESFLMFCSDRPGGTLKFNLYISFNENGKWTQPTNLGNNINKEGGGPFTPMLSPDGKYLFFANRVSFADRPLMQSLSYQQLVTKIRNPGNGLADIYQIDFNIAEIKKSVARLD